MNRKYKKKIIGLITFILFLSLVAVVIVWNEQNKPLTEKQAKQIVKEMNEKLVEINNDLWIFGMPTLKMGRTYELMGIKTYQKTDDANIKTIEQVKEETEKVVTPEAAEHLFYGIYMNRETPYYVESDGILYKHVNLSGVLCTGIYRDSEIVELSNDRIVAIMFGHGFDPDSLENYRIELLKINGNWYINLCDRN